MDATAKYKVLGSPLAHVELPEKIESVEQLEELLSRPYLETVEAMERLHGDIVVLGAGGKIGPTLAVMAARASREAGVQRRVYAASRFTRRSAREYLEANGVEVVEADLLEESKWADLPEAPNVLYLAGKKFGTKGQEPLTWVTNAYTPALLAKRYRSSRIVFVSTAQVYDFVHVSTGGATEEGPINPIGEYAMSRLGGERVFQHFASKLGVLAIILRLCYAYELRYGVPLDVALKVWRGEPVSLRVAYVNVIWQGDFSNIALRALERCANPPEVVNVSGPETVSIEWMAREFGRMLGKEPVLQGPSEDTALLVNTAKCCALFGYPRVPLRKGMEWVVHWVEIGGPTYSAPTHYDVRTGEF